MFVRMSAVVLMSFGFLIGSTFGQESIPTEKRIAWKTLVRDAFVEAVENQKLLVIVFLANPSYRNEYGNNLSNRQRSELDELIVHELADDAVFAIAEFDQRLGRVRDEHGNTVFTRLKLDTLPTITVIEPRTDALTERYRMEGFFKAADVVHDLKACLHQYAKQQAIQVITGAGHSQGKAAQEINTRWAFEMNPYEPAIE